MDTKNRYQTDLTDRQWAQVCRVIPAPKPGGRPAKYDRREIANALLYITRTGCQWRMLPKDLPPWRIVYWCFMQWRKDGTFARLDALPGGALREPPGRRRQPAAAIIDSQSVRTTKKGGRTAMTPVRGSTAASGTSWSTPGGCSCGSSPPPPMSRTGT